MNWLALSSVGVWILILIVPRHINPSYVILNILSRPPSASGSTSTIVLVRVLALILTPIWITILVKLLAIGKWIRLHGFECLIIVIVDVHLLHLLHDLAWVKGLEAHSAVPSDGWLVHQGYLGDLRLVLHAFVASSNADAAHERVLGQAVLRAISGRSNVLLGDVEVARRRTNPICHVLGLILDNV